MLFHTPEFLFYFLPAALLLHRLGPRSAAATHIARWPGFACWSRRWCSTDGRTPGGCCRSSSASSSTSAGPPYWSDRLDARGATADLHVERCSKHLSARILQVPGRGRPTSRDMVSGGRTLAPSSRSGTAPRHFLLHLRVVEFCHRRLQAGDPAASGSLDFFSFIAMFPRFVAGPIVRYRDISEQLRDYRGMRMSGGLSLFARGLFLKLCFARQLCRLYRVCDACPRAHRRGRRVARHLRLCDADLFRFLRILP